MFSFCSYWLRRLRIAVLLLAASTAAAAAGQPMPGPFAARVERVIDGDSLAVRVDIWPGLEVATIVRLRGIDAPELAGRCPEERRRAVAAREALAALVGAGAVSLAAVETDKYGGRVVADVADAVGRPLAAALVGAGLARRYDGGRREGWCPS